MAAAITASCEEYSAKTWSGDNRLNFVQVASSAVTQVNDTMQIYTFVLEPAAVTRQTIYVRVETMGDVYDYDRPVKLKQVAFYGKDGDKNDAVPGKHYVSFDDPEMAAKQFIPKGQVAADIPIILIRENLGTNEFLLRIEFERNDYFTLGLDQFSHRTVLISDQLQKPDNWADMEAYFGTYSQAKHQFMIDVTGLAIDYDYIKGIYATDDRGYYTYLRVWFRAKLAEAVAADPDNEELKSFSF